MTAQLLPFPNIDRPATPRDEPCVIVILPVIRTPRECPQVRDLQARSRRLSKQFNPKFSGADNG